MRQVYNNHMSPPPPPRRYHRRFAVVIVVVVVGSSSPFWPPSPSGRRHRCPRYGRGRLCRVVVAIVASQSWSRRGRHRGRRPSRHRICRCLPAVVVASSSLPSPRPSSPWCRGGSGWARRGRWVDTWATGSMRWHAASGVAAGPASRGDLNAREGRGQWRCCGHRCG